MKIHYKKSTSAAAEFLRRVILSWLVAVTVESLVHPASLSDLSAFAAISPLRIIAIAMIVFAALTALNGMIRAEAERWALAGTFALLAAVYLCTSFTWAFLSVCLLVLALLALYARKGWNEALPEVRPHAPQRYFGWLTAGWALAFFLLVSAWTVGRVRSFSAPTYDFGIFAQMFHSMKTTGLPITTVERDGVLSHFAVHVSPIYYLLLPFYCLAPRPETLQVLQAAVLASAVIPLWKLGKRHGLSPCLRCLSCVLLLLYPAYSGGASYDIHENAFLTPLILWLFYGIDCRRSWLTALSALLTLMVKEDAAVYVAVIALWLLAKSWLRREGGWGMTAGAAMLAGALGWFVAVTGYLSSSGDGVMTYRYQNFMYDGSASLVTVIKAVVLCPMKAVFECVDAEKLPFIAFTLLPLLGLPLLTRRYERYILLIPYVLVNLMSDYQYQHSIFFQYTYGAAACLFYLTVVNLADLRLEKHRLLALAGAVCVAAGCFGCEVLPVALKYPRQCAQYAGYYDDLRQTLSQIPADASVAATTFYAPYLSQRETLYDVRYAAWEHVLLCEYVALNPTESSSYKAYGSYDAFVAKLEASGYECIAAYSDRVTIFKRA